jgi:hypothetical protein
MVRETIPCRRRWPTCAARALRTWNWRQDHQGRRQGGHVGTFSGNRDEEVIERPNDYWIERPGAPHLPSASASNRCVGYPWPTCTLKIIFLSG